MQLPANTLRGEAPLKIGSVDLIVVIEFGRLVSLSKAVGTDSLDELYRRLLGFEPWTVACALRCLVLHEDGPEKEAALAAKAISELSVADEAAWQKAMNTAMLSHIEAGRKIRNDAPLFDQVETAVSGERASPS
ncbi:hypothetical protein AM571_CH01435 [Rhizobium etli 8C-3]|uniref:Uncharacterized protein n=1 Tax=Rhizobium etli 8C-3 TaxID=538025 RepID=A0A1L5P292_RHIET|nr:hypothetical protein [Rhizobium etli]APO74270.1 hypothetical protein AM571_CH01435 [Rhizobium etli 8C-3]